MKTFEIADCGLRIFKLMALCVFAGKVACAEPAITTLGASNITASAATLWGNLTAGSGSMVTAYWGRVNGGTTASAWQHSYNLGDTEVGLCSTQVVGLTNAAVYYFNFSAALSGTTRWASAKYFVTAASAPTSTPVIIHTNLPSAGGWPTPVLTNITVSGAGSVLIAGGDATLVISNPPALTLDFVPVTYLSAGEISDYVWWNGNQYFNTNGTYYYSAGPNYLEYNSEASEWRNYYFDTELHLIYTNATLLGAWTALPGYTPASVTCTAANVIGLTNWDRATQTFYGNFAGHLFGTADTATVWLGHQAADFLSAATGVSVGETNAGTIAASQLNVGPLSSGNGFATIRGIGSYAGGVGGELHFYVYDTDTSSNIWLGGFANIGKVLHYRAGAWGKDVFSASTNGITTTNLFVLGNIVFGGQTNNTWPSSGITIATSTNSFSGVTQLVLTATAPLQRVLTGGNGSATGTLSLASEPEIPLRARSGTTADEADRLASVGGSLTYSLPLSQQYTGCTFKAMIYPIANAATQYTRFYVMWSPSPLTNYYNWSSPHVVTQEYFHPLVGSTGFVFSATFPYSNNIASCFYLVRMNPTNAQSASQASFIDLESPTFQGIR